MTPDSEPICPVCHGRKGEWHWLLRAWRDCERCLGRGYVLSAVCIYNRLRSLHNGPLQQFLVRDPLEVRTTCSPIIDTETFRLLHRCPRATWRALYRKVRQRSRVYNEHDGASDWRKALPQEDLGPLYKVAAWIYCVTPISDWFPGGTGSTLRQRMGMYDKFLRMAELDTSGTFRKQN